jgi:hypothetical protein
MKKRFWIPLTAGMLFTIGCGGNKPADIDVATSASSTSSPSALVSSQSRSSSGIQLPSDAKEVVQLFFDSMRQGNAQQLSALLTEAARAEILKRGLVIDPMGTPMASFKIGDSTLLEDATLVSSVWAEPAQVGQEASEAEVVWELRKEATGWRICGLAVATKNSDEIEQVNFENMQEENANSNQNSQRVASLPNTTMPSNAYTPIGNLPSNVPSFDSPSLNSRVAPAVPASSQLPPVVPSFQPNGFNLPPANSNLPTSNGLPPANALPPSNNLPPSGFQPR